MFSILAKTAKTEKKNEEEKWEGIKSTFRKEEIGYHN